MVPIFYCSYFLFLKITVDGSPHTKLINRKNVVQTYNSSVPSTSAIQQSFNQKFYSQGVYKLLKIIDINNNINTSFCKFLIKY